MRSQAKAASAAPTAHQAKGLKGVALPASAITALLCFSVFLSLSIPASAATVTQRPLLFSFDGNDATAGPLNGSRGIAIDESTGNVYVTSANPPVVDKFSATGVAQNFTATGKSSLDESETPLQAFPSALAVDNSSANPGRLYVGSGQGPLYAFAPAGNFLCEVPAGPIERDNRGITVDTAGHLWVGSNSNPAKVVEFANSGCPASSIGSFSTRESTYPFKGLAVDANGDAYVGVGGPTGIDKYVGGVFSSTLDSSPEVQDVAVDQTSPSGHVFTLHSGSFNEYDSSGSLIGNFGAGLNNATTGIAYNASLDRVYVVEFAGRVKAFGPVTTGTVPTALIESTSEVGISQAKFNGTVNPEGVPNSYFFEWKQGEGEGWGAAQSSPIQSLPEDSSPHAVSFSANGLAGGTKYQVRLVVLNTSNGLREVSAADTFTTVTPPAPTVAINDPSSVTATTVAISGSVNPHGDPGTTWQLQLTADPTCSGGFSNGPRHNLESEATNPVVVSEELHGLLPSQQYCVRLSASNGGGTTATETKVFVTETVAPDEVQAMPAAPVLDTTARLNARVNPQGEDLKYHFEYSQDGGTTWTALPEQVETSGLRTQKVISEEATGLQPNTPYTYRVVVENPAGGGQGDPLSFTTRTTAAVTLPQRGYELVNTPDKGNQSLEALRSGMGDEPISPDGEKLLWSVTGGAPGGYNGTGATFLAERSPTGWHSRSVLPPAEEQIGGGSDLYSMVTHTPDLSSFVFRAARSVQLAGTSEATVVRLDDHQDQTEVRHYEENVSNENIDTTTDNSHILRVDRSTGQLVDIGSGTDEVISIMPDGNPSSCGFRPGESFTGIPEDGSTAGVSLQWRPGYHLINTSDASIVYFEAKPNGNCAAHLGLYVRDRSAETTTLIDPGLPAENKEPLFVRATPDGRYGYFTTPSQLDPNDHNEDRDIYRWDNQTGQATCLTCVVADAAVGEGTQPRILISNGFSHIYFDSKNQLEPGKGVAGQPSLYSLSGGAIHFVAAVGVDLSERGAQLSESGDSLVFMGQANPNLTGDSVGLAGSEGKECLVPLRDVNGSEGKSACEELYRYQDSDQSVECLSCNRSGATRYSVGTPCGCSNNRFAVSADGGTVVFATKERLLERDVNKTTDIYQWHNGTLGLITDGVSEYQENFAAPLPQAVSADGRDIFFRVQEPGLTGYEQDLFSNLYDARVGGGFPRPTPPVHCSEESCQGPLQAPPGQQQSGSSSFSGQGNVAQQPKASRCRKGKVRRHGGCVGRHAHKQHHKRASKTNRGGAK